MDVVKKRCEEYNSSEKENISSGDDMVIEHQLVRKKKVSEFCTCSITKYRGVARNEKRVQRVMSELFAGQLSNLPSFFIFLRRSSPCRP